jgi:hypothetical protein
MFDLQIDITDAKLLKRFGSHIWFIDDPRIVHVVRECRDGQPIIQHYLYRNLSRRGLCIPFYKHFQADRSMQYRCFYTGAEVYLTSGKLLGREGDAVSLWTIPWAATREHIAPRRERDIARINSIGNMVPCALLLNKQMAHLPLAMKLFERDFLHKLNFDRTAMTHETALTVWNSIIAFEQPFWFVDNYPWFPHAIKDPVAKRAADEFFAHLWQHEERFLALSWREQKAYLKRPCDLDIIHLAKTILNLTIVERHQ